jgi:hypothetical protein
MSPDPDPGFFLTGSGSEADKGCFMTQKWRKKMFFSKKAMMYISSQAFMKDLKLWKKLSADNDPFLRAILSFLRIKIAAITVYRSMKNPRGKNHFL